MDNTRSSHPHSTGRFLFMMANTVGSLIEMVPPSPMTHNMMPCRPRKNESVTTNDGMPSRATSRPMIRPITAPVNKHPSRAMGQAKPFWVMSTPRTAAEVPAAKPADRSISPNSRTKIRPIAT
jgi:hypothetical protein